MTSDNSTVGSILVVVNTPAASDPTGAGNGGVMVTGGPTSSSANVMNNSPTSLKRALRSATKAAAVAAAAAVDRLHEDDDDDDLMEDDEDAALLREEERLVDALDEEITSVEDNDHPGDQEDVEETMLNVALVQSVVENNHTKRSDLVGNPNNGITHNNANYKKKKDVKEPSGGGGRGSSKATSGGKRKHEEPKLMDATNSPAPSKSSDNAPLSPNSADNRYGLRKRKRPSMGKSENIAPLEKSASEGSLIFVPGSGPGPAPPSIATIHSLSSPSSSSSSRVALTTAPRRASSIAMPPPVSICPISSCSNLISSAAASGSPSLSMENRKQRGRRVAATGNKKSSNNNSGTSSSASSASAFLCSGTASNAAYQTPEAGSAVCSVPNPLLTTTEEILALPPPPAVLEAQSDETPNHLTITVPCPLPAADGINRNTTTNISPSATQGSGSTSPPLSIPVSLSASASLRGAMPVVDDSCAGFQRNTYKQVTILVPPGVTAGTAVDNHNDMNNNNNNDDDRNATSSNLNAMMRLRGFSIDMDYLELAAAAADDASATATQEGIGGGGRDRAFSFECFAFGINADEPLPPLTTSSSSTAAGSNSGKNLSHAPASSISYLTSLSQQPHFLLDAMGRPRGDSIIFDPSSFQDGGIHEKSALEKSRSNSMDYLAPTPDIATTQKNESSLPVPAAVVSETLSQGQDGAVQTSKSCSGDHNSHDVDGENNEDDHIDEASNDEDDLDGETGEPPNSIKFSSRTDPTIGAAPSVPLPSQLDVTVLNTGGRIGIYLPDARRARIARFHAKRAKRIWRKRIKYDCRKKLADSRPRVKGRFVKRLDTDD